MAEKDPAVLRILNAQMRRIDLICKLLGPLFIALLDGYSTQVAILVNLGMNVASVVVEYFAIARVYYQVDGLQQPKGAPTQTSIGDDSSERSQGRATDLLAHARAVVGRTVADFSLYFRHPAFLPSIAGALLYLTVLSFAGQMVTFLLSSGYTSTQVGAARTLAVVFEVLATWIAPWLMGLVGPVRAGLWLGSWQLAMLMAGAAVFIICRDHPLISASGIVGGTILSRVGLRGFDLCVQVIVQEVRGVILTVTADQLTPIIGGRGRYPGGFLIGRGGLAECL